MTIKPQSVRDLQSRGHIAISFGSILGLRTRPDERETWHEVGAGSAPAFESGWENYEAGTNPCGYRKDASGFVHMRGLIKGIPATGSGGVSVIFTLPLSWRPSGLEELPCRFQENQFGETDFLYIRPNGQVCLRWPVAGPFVRNALFLDNYRWRAAS